MARRERKKNRLKNYDYSDDGYYFVTICTKNRENFFGEIIDGKMFLNDIGKIVKQCWQDIPQHFPNAMLDEFVIMPNHIHGIIIIENDNTWNNVGNKNFCSLQNFCPLQENIPWQTKLSRSLSSIIRGFKIGVTKWCRQNGFNNFGWQRSFYDHIIRNEKSLNNSREYILNNPLKWDLDENNLSNNIPSI